MSEVYGMNASVLRRDTLLAGHEPVSKPVTLLSNGTSDVSYLKGTVLGVITASGKCTGFSASASDGSEKAKYILARDITVLASADAKCEAYRHGEFDAKSLIWTDETTTDEQKTQAYADLESAGVYVK